MIVPAAEFKDNFSEYLAMISVEDILVTKDDKIIARISKPPKEAEEKRKLYHLCLCEERTCEENQGHSEVGGCNRQRDFRFLR